MQDDFRFYSNLVSAAYICCCDAIPTKKGSMTDSECPVAQIVEAD